MRGPGPEHDTYHHNTRVDDGLACAGRSCCTTLEGAVMAVWRELLIGANIDDNDVDIKW